MIILFSTKKTITVGIGNIRQAQHEFKYKLTSLNYISFKNFNIGSVMWLLIWTKNNFFSMIANDFLFFLSNQYNPCDVTIAHGLGQGFDWDNSWEAWTVFWVFSSPRLVTNDVRRQQGHGHALCPDKCFTFESYQSVNKAGNNCNTYIYISSMMPSTYIHELIKHQQ